MLSETTCIVSGSGLGKSTIAQLLLRTYTPQCESLSLDDQDVAFLDPVFTSAHMARVKQGCILFDRSVHDNITLGHPGGRVSRAQVEDTSL